MSSDQQPSPDHGLRDFNDPKTRGQVLDQGLLSADLLMERDRFYQALLNIARLSDEFQAGGVFQRTAWPTEVCARFRDAATRPLPSGALVLTDLPEPSGNHCPWCGWSSGGHDPRCPLPPGSGDTR